MKEALASVLTGFGKPLELKRYPIPEKLEPDAVLVKVTMAGICGTDTHLWKGQLPIPLPMILGHETVGTIEAMGENVRTDWAGNPLKIGDRVTWSSSIVCGKCYFCTVARQPTRCINRKTYGVTLGCGDPPHLFGGHAEYVYLKPGVAIFRLTDDVPTEAIVGAGCAIVTAIHGAEHIGINWGDTVVIQGSGPVGLSALAVAKDSGAWNTMMIGGPSHRLELAKKFGADHCIDIEQIREPSERIRQVKSFSRGLGADVVLECVGTPQVVPEGLEMCRDGGKYLVLGHYADVGPFPINPQVITRKQLKVQGSWGYEPRHMFKAINFLKVKRKQYPFEEVVSRRFPFTEANEALQSMLKWALVKPVITP